jgi:hypothetical protein
MEFDFPVMRILAAAAALLAFNFPVVVAAWRLRKVNDLHELIREKDANGQSTGALSYSRVTGVLGAVVVASLFWIISNVVVATAILNPRALNSILNNIGTLFYVGAALFLPYAFNQLKTMVQ